MFSSFTSFLSSTLSSLPFRPVEGESGVDVPHPGSTGTLVLWKHIHAVRVTPGVGGAIQAVAAGSGSGGGVSGGSTQTGPLGSNVGDPLSVFTFDKRTASSDHQSLARNALQKLKILRHPNLIKYVDSIETSTHIHLLTERVQPLECKPIPASNRMAILAASLGLFQLADTLGWMNNEAKLVHGNIHPGSLYVNATNDWKLFGLDLCHKGAESIPDYVLSSRHSLQPAQYRAPELIKAGSGGAGSAVSSSVIHAADAWALGCMIYHVFNGSFHSAQQLAQVGSIPQALLPEYKKLLATSVSNRLNPRSLIDSSNFFQQNELISTVRFLDQLALKSSPEKDAFFTRFNEHLNDFPKEFLQLKILPQLTHSLDYGSGLTCFSVILSSVLRIGSGLDEKDFSMKVIPSVLRLFSNQERAIRVHLLQHLPEYAKYLTQQLINDTVFGQVAGGFGDANAVLREWTVKSLPHFAPKLNSANMETALKWLAKLQTDSEPAIRTNTAYCIAKIAAHLQQSTQEKVLFPAFARCLRDPFPPARVAGLMSMLATMELYPAPQVATKILPVAAPSLVDDIVEVREAAVKLVEGSLARVKQYHVAMSKAAAEALAANPNAIGSHQLQQQQAAAAQASKAGTNAMLENTSAVLGSLGSWAVSTVRSKMATASVNGPSAAAATANGPAHSAASLNPSQRNYSSASTSAALSSSSSIASAAASSAAHPSPSGASTASTTSSSPASLGLSPNDDFFSDFGIGKEGSDEDATPIATLSLGSKRKDSSTKREKKKSILSGGSAASHKSSSSTAFAISPPPSSSTSSATPAATASNSLDAWSFDMEETSGGASSALNVDDFDSWGSSITSNTSLSTKQSSSSSRKSSAAASSDLTDLLTSSTQHKKSPSTASPSSSSDPFTALSLSSKSSARSSSLSLSGGSKLGLGSSAPAGPKPSATAKSMTTKPSTKAAPAAVDDWSSFLNS